MIGNLLHRLSTVRCDSGTHCGRPGFHTADLTWIGRWRYTQWRPWRRTA